MGMSSVAFVKFTNFGTGKERKMNLLPVIPPKNFLLNYSKSNNLHNDAKRCLWKRKKTGDEDEHWEVYIFGNKFMKLVKVKVNDSKSKITEIGTYDFKTSEWTT